MADLAGLGADTYRIPTQTPYNAAGAGVPTGMQPFDDGLSFEKDLQEVEGKSQAYYEKVAALKAFMLDMHRNRGIDVRVPDLAHPDSIKLNQIYQRGLADIMHQANKMKVGQKEREYRLNNQSQLTDTGRANERAGNTLTEGEDFYSNATPGDVTAANQATLSPAHDKQQLAAEQANAKRVIDHYNDIKKKNPKLKEWADAQIDKVNNAVMDSWRPPNPWQYRETSADRTAQRQVVAHGNILKELVHLKNGVGFTETSKNWVNPNSPDHLLQTKPNLMDMKWNGKQVKEWGFDPLNDQSFLKFEDGTVEDVTKQDPMSLARVIVPQANWQYLEQAVTDNDWGGQFGELDQAKMLDPGVKEAKERSKMLVQHSLETNQYTALKAKVKAIVEGTSNLLGRSVGTFPLPNRADATVKKKIAGDNLLYISNFDEVFPRPPKTEVKKLEQWTRDRLKFSADGTGGSGDDMTTFLHEHGASQKITAASAAAEGESDKDRMNRLKNELLEEAKKNKK